MEHKDKGVQPGKPAQSNPGKNQFRVRVGANMTLETERLFLVLQRLVALLDGLVGKDLEAVANGSLEHKLLLLICVVRHSFRSSNGR
ncbi:hypothetical protein ACLOJK_001870 [Asimina triloba]